MQWIPGLEIPRMHGSIADTESEGQPSTWDSAAMAAEGGIMSPSASSCVTQSVTLRLATPPGSAKAVASTCARICMLR